MSYAPVFVRSVSALVTATTLLHHTRPDRRSPRFFMPSKRALPRADLGARGAQRVLVRGGALLGVRECGEVVDGRRRRCSTGACVRGGDARTRGRRSLPGRAVVRRVVGRGVGQAHEVLVIAHEVVRTGRRLQPGAGFIRRARQPIFCQRGMVQRIREHH
jgi:hypothetical protein